MIAKLRHTVIIQQKTDVADSRGGRSVTWAALATVSAEVKPRRVLEQTDKKQRQAQVVFDITMRYRSDVTARMRISFDSRFFYIKGLINVDERNRWLKLFCEEGDGISG